MMMSNMKWRRKDVKELSDALFRALFGKLIQPVRLENLEKQESRKTRTTRITRSLEQQEQLENL